jgi:hypothetical protein
MTNSYSGLSDDKKLKALLTIAQSQASKARIALERQYIDCENDLTVLTLATLIQDTKANSGLDWYNFHDRLMVAVALSTLKGLAFRTKPVSERTFNMVRAALYGYRKRHCLPEIKISDYRTVTNHV